jgi:hypothetical protein
MLVAAAPFGNHPEKHPRFDLATLPQANLLGVLGLERSTKISPRFCADPSETLIH